MPDSAVLVHLVLAATLVIAAVAKWRHPDRDGDALAGAGLPGWISSPVVRRWHPLAELVLGVGLVVLPSPVNLLPVVGAGVLVLAYLVIVVTALRAPEPVSCGCFGAEDSAPVTRRTLLRNLLLVLVAGVALVDAALGGAVPGRLTDPTAWGWLGGTALALGLLWSSFAPGAVPLPESGEQSGPARTEGSDRADDEEVLDDYVRTEIPDIVVRDPDGHPVSLRGLAGSGAQLLVFLSPGCGSCTGIARDLPRWRERRLPIAVQAVVHSRWAASPDTPVWLETALVDPDGAAAQALEVRGTPGAVLLGADGLLAGGPVVGSRAVREFYVEIAEQLEAATELS